MVAMLTILEVTAKFILSRAEEPRQGVVGLFQPGLAGERSPGLSVRFRGIGRSCLPVLVGGHEDGHRDVEAAGWGEVSSWRYGGRSSHDRWSITPSSTKPGNGHVYYSAEVLVTGALGILESVENGRKRGKRPLNETVGL
jgi:hypothetical protein